MKAQIVLLQRMKIILKFLDTNSWFHVEVKAHMLTYFTFVKRIFSLCQIQTVFLDNFTFEYGFEISDFN